MATKKHSSTKRRELKDGSETDEGLAVFNKLMKEPAKVTTDFVEMVDRRITYDPVRRGALVWLSKPFGEWVEQIHDDREAAVTFSVLAHLLDDTIKRFEALVDLLKAAQIQMKLAVCVRPDMDAIKTEARGQVGRSAWLDEVARRHQSGEDAQDIINDLKARARKTTH